MTNEMSLEIVQKAASPRRVRTLGGQFRKLPELTLHRPSLRLRGDTLWLTIKHDGKHQLRKSLGSGLSLGLTHLTLKSCRPPSGQLIKTRTLKRARIFQ